MDRYIVRFLFQKGSSKIAGSETVRAGSAFMAKHIAEGKARQKQHRDGYTFTVTELERREVASFVNESCE